MNRFWMPVLLVVFSSLCLGCDSSTPPQQAFEHVYSALLRGDLKEFRAALAGDALEWYGNSRGLRELQSYFAGYYGVRPGAVERLADNVDSFSRETIYQVQLVGTRQGHLDALKTAAVKCIWYHSKGRWFAQGCWITEFD